MSKTYYLDQLKLLKPSPYPISIKLWDGFGHSTNTMALNTMSAEALQDFIKALRLDKGKETSKTQESPDFKELASYTLAILHAIKDGHVDLVGSDVEALIDMFEEVKT